MGNIWENALSMWIILGLNWIKGVYDVDNMYRIIIKVFKWVYEWDNTGIGYIIWYYIYIYRVYKLMVKVDLWRDNKLNPMLYAITGIITRHFPNSFGWKTTASCTHFFLFWAVFFQVFGVCVLCFFFVFFFSAFELLTIDGNFFSDFAHELRIASVTGWCNMSLCWSFLHMPRMVSRGFAVSTPVDVGKTMPLIVTNSDYNSD